VSKFYAEPTGGNRNYNAKRAMDKEFEKLQKLLDISRPLAKNRKFNCAVVTEYVKGKPLNRYIKSEDGL
jgi:RIO-like serine/threonine protein kinase